MAARAASILCSFLFAASSAHAKDGPACEANFERAQELALEGNLLRARQAYLACAQQRCPTLVQAECAKRLEKLDVRIPSIIVAARTDDGADLMDVNLMIDGVSVGTTSGKAIEIDPGPHHVRVTRKDQVDEFDVVAREGEKLRTIVRSFSPAIAQESSVPLRRDAPSVPWTVFGFGAVAVVSVGSFAFFGIRGSSDNDFLHSTCSPGCSSGAEANVRNQLIVADISLAIGIAATAVALWSYVASRQAPARATVR